MLALLQVSYFRSYSGALFRLIRLGTEQSRIEEFRELFRLNLMLKSNVPWKLLKNKFCYREKSSGLLFSRWAFNISFPLFCCDDRGIWKCSVLINCVLFFRKLDLVCLMCYFFNELSVGTSYPYGFLKGILLSR